MDFENYTVKIEEVASRLTQHEAVALCLLCCNRLAPLYAKFSEKEDWGDISMLACCRTAAYNWLRGADVDAAELLQQLESVIPDTEDFDSIECSYALNAAVAHVHLIEQTQIHECTPLKYALQSCYDTVDFAVHERLDPECKGGLEAKRIESDPNMIGEVAWQFEKMWELAGCSTLAEFVDAQVTLPVI